MTPTNDADSVRSEISETASDKRVSGLVLRKAEVEVVMERLSRCPCCAEEPVLGPRSLAA